MTSLKHTTQSSINLGITTGVIKKIFNQNKNRFSDALVELIADRALELGYDNDDTNFLSFYNFDNGYQAGKVFNDEFMNMGYQPEIKHLGVPHAPKHLRQPTRYSDTEDYKRRQQTKIDDEFFSRRHLQPVSSINPLEERKHESLKKRFNERLDKERSQIVTSKETYKRMLDKLMSDPFILKPIPPKEMVPLKPYAEILFEKNNEELIDYFK